MSKQQDKQQEQQKDAKETKSMEVIPEKEDLSEKKKQEPDKAADKLPVVAEKGTDSNVVAAPANQSDNEMIDASLTEQSEESKPMEVATEEKSKKRERDEGETVMKPAVAAAEDTTSPPKVDEASKNGKVDKVDTVDLKAAAKTDGGDTDKQQGSDNEAEDDNDGSVDKKPEAKKPADDEHDDDEDDDEDDGDAKETDEPKLALPPRPIKRARTAYFIFADAKREEIKAKHPGEGVGVLAKATGQLWATLSEEDRTIYHEQSARERERVAQELAKYKLEGIDVSAENKAFDPHALIYPVARIRKICKLDPDVNGISKEAAILITKCAELATTLLGQEVVKVAQMQNRRKLLPEDVAQVCATRESFLFLREDVKDLVRDQKNNKSAAGAGSDKVKPAAAATAAAAANSRPLTSYFGAK